MASDFTLPAAPLDGCGRAPDIIIRRAHPDEVTQPLTGDLTRDVYCQAPCHRGEIVRRLAHGPGGTWVWNRSVGVCFISADGTRIDVVPDGECDDHLLSLVLAGQILILALHKQRTPVLHASGVRTEHGCLAFTGPAGQGKSTLAASFLRRGAALVSDDALPLRIWADHVEAAPSLPFMKLWPQTAECALETPHNLPAVERHSPKKLFDLDGHYAFASTASTLNVIYVLDRYTPSGGDAPECHADTLPGRAALLILLEQTAFGAYLSPADAAKLLPRLAAVLERTPVRVLHYPTGFAHQDRVHAWIVADLATLRRTT